MSKTLRSRRIFAAVLVLPAVLLLLNVAARADEAEDAFNFATGLLIKKDYALALDEYAGFLKRFPTNPKAREAEFRRAECLYRLQRADEAVAALAAFEKRYPDDEQRPVAAWWQGELLLQKKDYAGAAAAYAVIADKFPKHSLAAAARYWQGESLLRGEKYDEAAKVLARAAAGGEEKYAAPALAGLGWAEFYRAQYAEAFQHFQDMVRRYPDAEATPAAALQAAECLARLNRLKEAQAAFAEVERRYGKLFGREVLLGRARLAFDAGDYAAAAPLFLQAADAFADDPGAGAARMNAAVAYYRAGDPAKAGPLFARVAADKAMAAEALYWQAKCLEASDKRREALPLFQRSADAAADAETRARAQVGLGDALLALKEYDAAVAAYDAAVKSQPRGSLAETALYSTAFCLGDQGKLDAAIAVSRRLLAALAGDKASDLKGRAEFALAEFLFRKKDFAAAATIFAQLAKDKPAGVSAATAASRRAWCALEQGRRDEAEQLFTAVVHDCPRAPEAAEAAFMRGRIKTDAGEADAALVAFRACAKDYADTPHAVRAATEIGVILFQQKKYAEAKAALAPLAKDDNPRAQLFLAESELELGDAAAALPLYQQLAARKPSPDIAAAARRGGGFAFRAAKNYAAAAQQFVQCAEQYADDPGAPDALFWAGRSLEDAGQAAAAMGRYEQLLRKYPKSPLVDDAAWQQALLESRNHKNPADAARSLARFVQQYPKSAHVAAAVYELAWVYAGAGDRSNAAAQFERLLRDFPADALAADAAFRLGEFKYDEKDYAGAAALYQRALKRKDLGFRDKVLYKLAWAQQELDKPTAAEAAFAAVATQFPKSDVAGECAWRAGRLLLAAGKHADAAAMLARVEGEFADRAAFDLGQVELARHDWAAARRRFEGALKEYPKSAVAAEMRFGLGQALAQLGADADAERQFREVAAGSATVTAARAQFGLGELRYARKQYAEAGRAFLKVAVLYAYDEWKRKGYLMAARSFAAAGEPERAARYYSEVVKSFAGSDEAKQAAPELAKLPKK